MLFSRSPYARSARRRKIPQTAAAQIEVCEQRLMLSAAAEPAPVDGLGNNPDHPEWGSTDVALLRQTTVDYADGAQIPSGQDRPGPREVSNAVVSQLGPVANDRYLTDFIWIWGQFVDHDIDLTESAHPAEPLPISVPAGDPYFDPFGSGTASIDFNRSAYLVDAAGVRQQINQITAYIDGSVVYGSDAERAAAVRTFAGGRLQMSAGNLLPFNEAGLPNAGGPSDALFLAGDVRANENVALSAMHTLWVREHNRLADEIAAEKPQLTDEQIYQHARAVVTAEIQAITYNEFLPALLGPDAPGDYQGYDPTVNAGIANVFSTAAYRLGHSLLSPELLRVNDDGSSIDEGHLPLREAFFNPGELIATGIEPLLAGASYQKAQELDSMIIDDVRNFLFGPPGAGGFDLASLNIQRGRDHGLPGYNQVRVDLGLEPAASFADISSDPLVQARLASVYGTVEQVDAWVGGLAEDHRRGSSVGELLTTIIADQFQRLRAGDRFWYENVFHGAPLREIASTTLADVVRRNTNVTGLQENVFFDRAVLYHRLEADAHGEVTVRANGHGITVIDRGARDFVQRPWEGLEQLVLAGSTGRSDRIRLDVADAGPRLPGGIVVIAGVGGHDALRLQGSSHDDEIVVDGFDVTVNGMPVFAAGFETLFVDAGPGDDRVTIVDAGSATVLVLGGPGNDLLVGGAGDEHLIGGPGRDVIVSGGGTDLLVGGPGRETIDGQPEDDAFNDDHDRRRRRRRHHRHVAHGDADSAVHSDREDRSGRRARVSHGRPGQGHPTANLESWPRRLLDDLFADEALFDLLASFA